MRILRGSGPGRIPLQALLGPFVSIALLASVLWVEPVPCMARPRPASEPSGRPSKEALRAARAHFKQGRAFYEAGVYSDAVREYERAFALAPLPELLFNIGQAHRMRGAKPEAIAAYDRYLKAVPEGPLAEEARNHVAMLRSRIQLEEAEAARKKAEAEAAEARRLVDAAEAARRKAEEEASARKKTKADDEARLRRLAKETAARERTRRVEAERARERRLAAAEPSGRTLRQVGIGLMVSGAASLWTFGSISSYFYFHDVRRLHDWKESPGDPWTTSLEKAANGQRSFLAAMMVTGIAGVVLLIGGGIVYQVGKRSRLRAREAAMRHVEITPTVGPGSAGLLLKGRF